MRSLLLLVVVVVGIVFYLKYAHPPAPAPAPVAPAPAPVVVHESAAAVYARQSRAHQLEADIALDQKEIANLTTEMGTSHGKVATDYHSQQNQQKIADLQAEIQKWQNESQQIQSQP